MSKPTAGKIIDDLVRAGVVEEVKVLDGVRLGIGRPGRRLGLATNRPRFVAIELGAEWTRIAALPPSPAKEERWEVQFKTPTTASAWQERVAQSAERIDIRRPWAVLVSTPGVVDERAGRVLLSPNLHWSEDADLPGILQQIWAAPVGLVQNVRALALGELAERPGGDDFIMVDISEGIGAALMLGGRPYEGPLPMSGEIGHIPIPGNTRLCGCGGRGCLETLASQRGLVQSLRESGSDGATFADVARAAEEPLPAWLRSTFDALGTCIVAALNLYGVRRVVMVGRIVELPSPATDYLVGLIQRASMWSRFDAVAVALAQKHVARGLVVAGIHRFVMPLDWSDRP